MARFPVQMRFAPYNSIGALGAAFGWNACDGYYDDGPLPPLPTVQGPPGCVPVVIGTVPSGYAQVIAGTLEASPILAAHDPAVGALVRDTLLPAGIVGRQDEYEYLEPEIPDGRIGVLAIGISPIGWRRPYHEEIFLVVPADGSGETELDPITIGQTVPTFGDGTRSFTDDFTADFA